MVRDNVRADGRGSIADYKNQGQKRPGNKLTLASRRFYFACLAVGMTPTEARAQECQVIADVRAAVKGEISAAKAKRLAVRLAA